MVFDQLFPKALTPKLIFTMRIILFLFILLISPHLFSQDKAKNPTADSLELALTQATSQTQKIALWEALAHAYKRSDPEKVLSYAQNMIDLAQKDNIDTLLIYGFHHKGGILFNQGKVEPSRALYTQALELSKKIQHKPLIAASYRKLGSSYLNTGEVVPARTYFEKALVLQEELGDPLNTVKVHTNIAITYARQGNLDKALESFEATYQGYKALGNESGMMKALTNIGIVHHQLGNDKKNLEYAQKALKIAEKIKDLHALHAIKYQMALTYEKQGDYVRSLEIHLEALEHAIEGNLFRNQGASYMDIANLYNSRNEEDKALEYYDKAQALFTKVGDKGGLADTYGNIANIYIKLEDYGKALEATQKGLVINEELEDPLSISSHYNRLCLINNRKSKYEEALLYGQKALDIASETTSKIILAPCYQCLADTYWAIGQLNLAQENGEKAYQFSKETGYKEDIKRASETLSRIYEKQGNYLKALDFYRIYKSTSDSLLNEAEIKRFTTLENQNQFEKEKALAQAEQEKKELSLAHKIQEQKNLRNIFLLGFVLIALLAFFLYRGYTQKQKANKALEEKNDLISLQAEELKITNENLAELDRFKQNMTDMLVHDLKNPLNSIIGLTQIRYEPQHILAIEQAGHTMLNLVNNMLDVQKFEETEIKLHREVLSLHQVFDEAYQEVAYLFREKNIRFHLGIPQEQKASIDADLIRRVMINLLNNAGKYTPNNGVVSVSLVHIHGANLPEMKILVKDNGLGIPAEEMKSIFDKYTHLDLSPRGRSQSTGLGLTFCKLAVEAHQGQIGVNAHPGEGSIFWFTLPLLDQVAVPLAHAVETEPKLGDSVDLELLPEEKKLLQPYARELSQYKVYEVSPIKSILKSLGPLNTDNLIRWKTVLEDSMFTGNEQRFKDLLDMID